MENHSSEPTLFLGTLRSGLWLFGVSCWLFGVVDRSIASFADGYLSPLDSVQLFTAIALFISWLFLKPTSLKFRFHSKSLASNS
ncbi:hypothetical protein H6G00_31230 [Leptolyngbya sp. FACHB-541]|uniref:hypothetical protein n=1 Tax=Leptolyngbya sp. FACHB-541 TaxID=2692810 RepID=UPI001683CB0A|nr:hypothetical protein [Leptolyngbya sp. FACHB-541]MBD2001019.1 hypothetical protein [Leptolyngbya sp. FACHB-541]